MVFGDGNETHGQLRYRCHSEREVETCLLKERDARYNRNRNRPSSQGAKVGNRFLSSALLVSMLARFSDCEWIFVRGIGRMCCGYQTA
jgi:hypothetical protein